jgi:hypothetical protein
MKPLFSGIFIKSEFTQSLHELIIEIKKRYDLTIDKNELFKSIFDNYKLNEIEINKNNIKKHPIKMLDTVVRLNKVNFKRKFRVFINFFFSFF